jgi:hypothetical protein
MKQILILFTALCLFFNESSSQELTRIYDPYAVQRDVEAFHQLSVSGAFKVIVKQGSETGVAVSSDNIEIRDAIQTKVQNGVLRVQLTGGQRINLKGKTKLIVYVSVKDIDSISLSGACTMVVDGKLNENKLGISISGASDLDVDLNVKKTYIRGSGASNLKLKGSTESIEVKLSGASDMNAIDLISNDCRIEMSGASDMHISVNQNLDAIVSGASDLKFRGSVTKVFIKNSGASSVKRLQ